MKMPLRRPRRLSRQTRSALRDEGELADAIPECK